MTWQGDCRQLRWDGGGFYEVLLKLNWYTKA